VSKILSLDFSESLISLKNYSFLNKLSICCNSFLSLPQVIFKLIEPSWISGGFKSLLFLSRWGCHQSSLMHISCSSHISSTLESRVSSFNVSFFGIKNEVNLIDQLIDVLRINVFVLLSNETKQNLLDSLDIFSSNKQFIKILLQVGKVLCQFLMLRLQRIIFTIMRFKLLLQLLDLILLFFDIGNQVTIRLVLLIKQLLVKLEFTFEGFDSIFSFSELLFELSALSLFGVQSLGQTKSLLDSSL